MPTIAFVSSKGGVGKTTSALLLALGLAEGGDGVSLVDSDPNLPLTAWAELPGRPPQIELFHAPHFQELPSQLRRAKAAASWVVVDTEGGAPRMGGMAIANADLVITPLAASVLEAREALKVAKLVTEVSRREGRDIPVVGLFARTPAGVRRSFAEISDTLVEAGLPMLGTVLGDREVFRTLFSRGGGLHGVSRRTASGAPAARALVQHYTAEVRALLA